MKPLTALFTLLTLLAFGCSPGQTEATAPVEPASSVSVPAPSQPAQTESANDEERAATSSASSPQSANQVVATVGDTQLVVALADTDAARALAQHLQDGPIAVSLHAYGGFEQVGPLPWSLPTSDQQVTTQAGDVMLYQGNQITFFTGSNTWAYTPLGQVVEPTGTALADALSGESVTVELSLAAA